MDKEKLDLIYKILKLKKLPTCLINHLLEKYVFQQEHKVEYGEVMKQLQLNDVVINLIPENDKCHNSLALYRKWGNMLFDILSERKIHKDFFKYYPEISLEYKKLMFCRLRQCLRLIKGICKSITSNKDRVYYLIRQMINIIDKID
jgi:hypothetical protein